MKTHKTKRSKNVDVTSTLFLKSNFMVLCRICLLVKKRTVLLTSEHEMGTLSSIFHSVTGIEVLADGNSPQHLCLHCKGILLDFYAFKKKCLNSNTVLNDFIQELIKNEIRVDGNSNHGVSDGEDVANICKKEDIKPPSSLLTSSYGPSNVSASVKSSQMLQYDADPLADTTVEEHGELSPSYHRHLFDEDVNGVKKLNVKGENPQNNLMQERKLHVCSVCKQDFRSAKSLRIHNKIHHTESSSIVCTVCNEGFETERDLRLHAAIHQDGPPWKCTDTECDKLFPTKYAVRRHVRRHMDGKRHACERCGRGFSEHYALVRHLRTHTGHAPDKKHACHLCDKRYTQAGALREHMARHAGGPVVTCTCSVCGRGFASPRLLASHARTHDPDKPHQCKQCNTRFRHMSSLRAHERLHSGLRPYVCARCGKSFAQSSNLTQHRRTHTGEKPYQCSKCERQFSSRSSLTVHERRHVGLKPYGCHICGMRFAGAELRGHLRRHAGERPFACGAGACARRFYTRAACRDHQRVHTGIKPYECALCQKKVASKSYLVKHLKAHETKKSKGIKERPEPAVVNKITDGTPYNCTEEVIIGHEDTGNIDISSVNDTIILSFTDNPSLVLPETNVVDDTATQCLSQKDLNFVNDMNVNGNVNFVTVSEEEVSLATSCIASEGASVKLYQVDQSLLQISSSGGQVTISKITSKMTANFE